MWPHTTDGIYTAKSGYKALIEPPPTSIRPSSSNPHSDQLWSIVWSAKVPNKIKHFLWKICQNILPTRENLCKKRIPLSHLCPVCSKETETLEHLFLLCEWTKPLWSGLQFVTPPSPFGLSTIQNWLMEDLDSPTAQNNSLSSWIFYTLLVIWNARNEVVFNNKFPNPLNCLHRVKSQCFEFLLSSGCPISPNPNPNSENHNNFQDPPITWRPPRDPYVKFNCDATFDKNTSKGYSGMLCRDIQGALLTASSTRFFANFPLVAEALSLRDTISFAANLQFPQALFESDNQTLIEMCRGNLIRKEIEGIVTDIISLKSKFIKCGFTWTKREGNTCAHTIAELARGNLLHGSWALRSPSTLRRNLVMDAQAF